MREAGPGQGVYSLGYYNGRGVDVKHSAFADEDVEDLGVGECHLYRFPLRIAAVARLLRRARSKTL